MAAERGGSLGLVRSQGGPWDRGHWHWTLGRQACGRPALANACLSHPTGGRPEAVDQPAAEFHHEAEQSGDEDEGDDRGDEQAAEKDGADPAIELAASAGGDD